jgi:ADP-heptose:LPS heptosyltransferase
MQHPTTVAVREPHSILVIKPSSLGDVVHTTPAVACIRRRWPDARLSWLVNTEWAPILEGNPDVDEIVEFPRRKFDGVRGWTRLPAWSRELRARVKPDLVLDFQGLLRSAIIARMAGGECWGTSDSREGARLFHNRVVPVAPRTAPVHAVRRYLALAEALGCDISGPPTWRIPEGTAPEDVAGRFVLLHPFSRGSGKSLTADEIAAFCRALAPVHVVLAGRSGTAIAPAPNVTNLVNRTSLAGLCWLVRNAIFVVSVDSGPMHIAAAVTPNLLGIHTWSDPRKVGPFRPEAFVWKDGTIASVANFPGGESCPRDAIGRWVAQRCGNAA